jgi:PrcB C-terminal/Antistasin family
MLRKGARIKPFSIGVLGLSLAATLGAAGCTPQDLEEFFGDVKNPPNQPTGTTVPFQVFSDDTSAVSAKETRALIRTSQGYVSLFGHEPPAGVDFSTDWVIFYSAGTRPTGGYEAGIASLTRAGSQLIAVTSLLSPGSLCIEPQIVTTPNVLIKFAAQTGASIEFFKSDVVNDCEPNNPCAAVTCRAGDVCVVQQVECFAAPCPPIGVCVPGSPAVHCGGIAGIRCPGSGQCVDDPSDSCDPNNGGADCGGICQCIETVSCIIGDVFDSSPGVCACVPKSPPMCPPVCAIFCAYGNVLDANGCPTCTCNPPPKM